MFESEEDQQHFLAKYNISQDQFRKSLITWDTLREIVDDFEAHKNEYLNTVQEYALAIQQNHIGACHQCGQNSVNLR